jgi:hypothetical protein
MTEEQNLRWQLISAWCFRLAQLVCNILMVHHRVDQAGSSAADSVASQFPSTAMSYLSKNFGPI